MTATVPRPPSARPALRAVRDRVVRLAEAATTPLLPADYLDMVNPLRAGADLRGRVIAVHRETRDAATLVIRPGADWQRHVPGQWVRIGIDVDGVRMWRAYSLTSHLDRPDGCISITVKAIPGGKVSHHLVHRTQPGTLVHLDQATGEFVLPAQAPAKVLFVTAAAGIAELVPDLAERATWACGPVGMLEALEEHWSAAGIADRLFTERFRPTVVVAGEGGTVTFTGLGTSVEADGATPILDVAEDAGVLMPSGCRMGICYGCVLPLREGAVRDLRTGELTVAAPGDGVLIQTCVSAAAGACDIDH